MWVRMNTTADYRPRWCAGRRRRGPTTARIRTTDTPVTMDIPATTDTPGTAGVRGSGSASGCGVEVGAGGERLRARAAYGKTRSLRKNAPASGRWPAKACPTIASDLRWWGILLAGRREELGDSGQQGVATQGLGHEAVHAGTDTEIAIFGKGVGGHTDNGNEGRVAGKCTDSGGGLIAVEFGHLAIHQNHVVVINVLVFKDLPDLREAADKTIS